MTPTDRRLGQPPSPIFNEERAAAELGLTEAQLTELCLTGRLIHSDLGPGTDSEGVDRVHLLRWTPAMMEEAHRQLDRLRAEGELAALPELGDE